MSRFFSALLGAFTALITTAQAETVTRAPAPPLLVMPEIGQTSPTSFGDLPAWPVAETAPPIAGRVAAQSDISAFGFPCTVKMDVAPKRGALLDIAISAPCKPYETVRILHAGLSFDVGLSLTGQAQVTMPAMAYSSEIDTIFEDQTRLSTPVVMPELAEYVRIAVGWDHLDARIEGDAPRFLPLDAYVLGDGPGRVLQILSHHLDPESRSGVIRLSVRSEVTAQNCKASQQAQVLQHFPGTPATRYSMELAKPGCHRIGDNLVLKNILPDMKLAAN